MAGGGDVNGDGRADVIIGAPAAIRNGKDRCGMAHVVFGKGRDSTAPVDLAALGSSGFAMEGLAPFDYLGTSVAAGDVNGDGLADVVVGAVQGYPFNGLPNPGAVFVIYGRRSTANVDLSNLGSGGFRLNGSASDDGFGSSVAVVGDMTGDGRPEIAVVAPFASDGGRAHAGAVYVIFGAASSAGFPLSQISAYGFRIDGAGQNPNDMVYATVAGGGDVNGDGRGDVVIGARFLGNGKSLAGTTYVVYGRGRDMTAPVDLAVPSQVGIRIDGAVPNDLSGTYVATGDVNGDGRTDVIVNASISAAAHVIYGFGTPELAYTAKSITGTVGNPIATLVPSRIKRTGTASFAISPTLPIGLALDSKTGKISGTPISAQTAKTYTVTMADLAGSATTPLTIEIKAKGSPPPPPPPAKAPVLDRFAVTPARFTTKTGARMHYRLSRAATVTLRFEHALRGHTTGKRCLVTTNKACTRYTAAGTLKLKGNAGTNTFSFKGRVNGKSLTPGAYRITATATAARMTSRPTATNFRILPGK